MPSAHILLISGPSGGGKSAFIRQLQQGKLPPAITEALPQDCHYWPLIEANDILKGDLDFEEVSKQLRQGDSHIVHYDIVFLHCRKLTNYEQDPAMALWSLAQQMTAVFVRPDAVTVRHQHQQRSARQQQKKSAGSRLWARWVRMPLRRLKSVFTGKSTLSTTDLYADETWINDCYQQWQQFLTHQLGRIPHSSLLLVAPDKNSTVGEAFVLLDQVQTFPQVS